MLTLESPALPPVSLPVLTFVTTLRPNHHGLPAVDAAVPEKQPERGMTRWRAHGCPMASLHAGEKRARYSHFAETGSTRRMPASWVWRGLML